jgi:hypothetical protein
MVNDRGTSKSATGASLGKVAGVIAVIVLMGVGVAAAAVPNSATGKITACAVKAGPTAGQLRVIDSQVGAHCKSTERALSWPQRALRFRGTWGSTARYLTDDVVTLAGSAYVAIATSKNVAPPSTATWRLLAAKGSAGAPGAAAPHPAHVKWVAQSGGDFTSVNAALNSITDNSSANRYVIKVAPGTYVEAGGVDMKDYVDIEGSGRDTTVISCACGTGSDPIGSGSSATLRMIGPALTAELRDIAIQNTGGGTWTTAIWIGSVQHSARLVSVAADVVTGQHSFGLYTHDAAPLVNGLSIQVEQGTVYSVGYFNAGGSTTMSDVDITANSTSSAYGMNNYLGTATINGGFVTATGSSARAIQNGTTLFLRGVTATATTPIYSSGATNVSNGIVSGGPVSGSGFTCLNVTNQLGVALSGTCA